MFCMHKQKKFTSSLKKELKKIKENNFYSINDFLATTYAILLANYTDENEILIDCNSNSNGNSEQTTLKINIDFEDTENELLAKVSSNSSHPYP